MEYTFQYVFQLTWYNCRSYISNKLFFLGGTAITICTLLVLHYCLKRRYRCV